MDNIIGRVWRGEVVESVHRAHIAVVDHTGRLLYSLGDPMYVTYWRSSSKPIQALPLVETGGTDAFGLTEPEVAVTCASHNGEDFHTDAVRSLLSKAGLSPDDLQCGPHDVNRAFPRRDLPLDQKPGRIHNNCSGKHAGMLTLCKHHGWPHQTYRDPMNPAQRLILKTLSEISGYPADRVQIGVDGCGVPVFAMPIQHMALTFARLARPDTQPETRQRALRRVRDAMIAHPQMVAGTGRFDTALMRAGRGTIVCKGGAAALHCCGLTDRGIGVAVKIEDAGDGLTAPAQMEVLRQVEALTAEALEELRAFRFPPVTNTRDEVVGRIETRFTLERVS